MPELDLVFKNNYGIYIFVYLLIPILLLYKMRFSRQKNVLLDLSTATQLQGFFITVIVLHHIAKYMDAGHISVFRSVASSCVGVFFAISGYGLLKSLRAKQNYLHKFVLKKTFRVILPFIILNAITTIILLIFGNSDFNLQEILSYLFSLKLIDDTQWFIITIFIFYTFFYISFAKNSNLKSIIKLLLLVIAYIFACNLIGLGKWVYISSFSFPLGIAIAYYEESILKFLSRWSIPAIITFGFAFLIGKYFDLSSYILGILFSTLILLIFSRININSWTFNKLGMVSLEIYLLHMKILALFQHATFLDSGVWIVLYFIALILTALCFNKFNIWLYKILSNKYAK